METLRVIDSHTGGEPTRVVVDGGPDLGRGSMGERRECLKAGHDWLRSAVVNEPRGSDAMVGALLSLLFLLRITEPRRPKPAAATSGGGRPVDPRGQ